MYFFLKFQLELERLPSPDHEAKQSKISQFGMLIVIFSVIFMIYQILIRLVEEKTIGFREQLRNVTKYNYLNNFVLFLVNLLQLFLIFAVCYFITIFFGVWEFVADFYVILLLFLFVVAVIAYTFFVSSLFESSECKIRRNFRSNF